MATDIIKSIGTNSRDYPSLSAWAAAIPPNLVTADERWIGEVYNDSELDGTSGNAMLLTGKTTDATRCIILRAASGHSFKDHADKATNPLRYNPSVGAAIKGGGGLGLCVLRIEVPYVTIEGLQLHCVQNGGGAIYTTSDANYLTVRDCILFTETAGTEGIGAGVTASGTNSLVVNCAHYCTDTGVGACRGFSSAGNSATFINCTTVNLYGSSIRAGFTRSYDTPIAKNCCAFGYSDTWGSSWSSSSEYNATNGTTVAGSTGAVTGLTTSSQFENVAGSGTIDLRLKSGSALIDAGNKDATNAPNDIIGRARGSTLDADIGAWEYYSDTTFAFSGGSVAAVGHATLVGDPDAFTKFWRVPSNAAQGTTGRMIVFAAGSTPTTVAYEGSVTADSNGNFDLNTNASDAAGTKRFAVVHAWNGVTGTTSIYGGPAIGEIVVV